MNRLDHANHDLHFHVWSLRPQMDFACKFYVIVSQRLTHRFPQLGIHNCIIEGVSKIDQWHLRDTRRFALQVSAFQVDNVRLTDDPPSSFFCNRAREEKDPNSGGRYFGTHALFSMSLVGHNTYRRKFRLIAGASCSHIDVSWDDGVRSLYL